jgi:xanthine dehydrogenase YagT iron-sulfur-binding subunit
MNDKRLGEDFEIEESPETNADEEKLLDQLGLFGEARRKFLGHGIAGGLGIFALQLLAKEQALATLKAPSDAVFAQNAGLENPVKISMKVNGAARSLEVDSRMSLLDTLRERLDLTGTKKGCDQGQCGACTVIVNGNRVLSCLTLAAQCRGKEVTTIEGLAKGDELHPMQAAFIKHDGFQ